MNFETKTYRMKVQTFPILGGPLERPSGVEPNMAARGEAVSNFGVSYFSDTGFGVSNLGIWGFLAWLQLWFSALADRSLMTVFARHEGGSPQGYQRPPSLLPEAARAAYAPRIMDNRQTRRILARGLPPSRLYAALHHLNARRLNMGQFMERACKLSASNRIVIYRLSGRKRLCQRRHEFVTLGTGPSQMSGSSDNPLSFGVCDAHLWPS